MGRADTIQQIIANANRLDDAQLTDLAALTERLATQSIYATLSAADKAAIEQALGRMHNGEGIPSDDVFAGIDAALAKARSVS